MNTVELNLGSPDYPEPLSHINNPPGVLYCAGASLKELMLRPRVAIVGTRRMTFYGKKVTAKFAADLAEQGVVIVSGLALGVDVLAHETVLEAGGTAIAVLPGPLDNIVPVANRRIADKIIERGGALVTEKEPGERVFAQDFVARNRIVSGLSQAVLITEAREGSGTFHTAGFAETQNRDLFVVPGNIDNPGSAGANSLLKKGYAQVATSYLDILDEMGLIDHFTPVKQVRGRNPQEQAVLDLILNGVHDGERLLELSRMDISQFNQTLTMLEISSKIRPLGANHWAIT